MELKFRIKKIVVLICFTFSVPSLATASINDMQSCQALLDFINSQLDGSDYPSTDTEVIRKGLKLYNQHIQEKIVTPGLIQFNSGDTAKADVMQEQVDAYKEVLVNSFKSRFPQKRLYMDQAVALNNCTQKAVPSDESLERLKEAMDTIVKLAQMN